MERTALYLGVRKLVRLAGGALLAITSWSLDAGTKISPGEQSRPPTLAATASETGTASYYGAKYHGKTTASGEVFDMNDFTAAHPRLAFGTRVRVTSLESNRSVVVRVNDRGPFVKGRVIDLSQAAAAALEMGKSGLARVRLEVVK